MNNVALLNWNSSGLWSSLKSACCHHVMVWFPPTPYMICRQSIDFYLQTAWVGPHMQPRLLHPGGNHRDLAFHQFPCLWSTLHPAARAICRKGRSDHCYYSAPNLQQPPHPTTCPGNATIPTLPTTPKRLRSQTSSCFLHSGHSTLVTLACPLALKLTRHAPPTPAFGPLCQLRNIASVSLLKGLLSEAFLKPLLYCPQAALSGSPIPPPPPPSFSPLQVSPGLGIYEQWSLLLECRLHKVRTVGQICYPLYAQAWHSAW